MIKISKPFKNGSSAIAKEIMEIITKKIHKTI